ncbi:MAG TPA: DeoR/GlpR family DNA-binding transcription regulator [Rectinemataceae bacterium]|nr:DeoR/GlpR family DNA-binding transcription regulator [Rectinemataceae bacterium]
MLREREERFDKIKAELAKNGKVYNDDIARILDVSLATVRRDLEAMEALCMLRRTHGGAVAAEDENELPFYSKTKTSQAEKFSIGLAAASLIPQDAVIGCTGGTTIVSVMRALKGKRLTVVTNAINVAMELVSFDSIEVIVSGGSLRPRSYELIGQVADRTVGEFHFSIALLGVDGFSVEHGLSTYAIGEAHTAALYIKQADEAWVVADHNKIGRIAPALIAPISRVKRLITDDQIGAEERRAIEAAGVEVIIAAP